VEKQRGGGAQTGKGKDPKSPAYDEFNGNAEPVQHQRLRPKEGEKGADSE
jgi:hypothetical protein